MVSGQLCVGRVEREREKESERKRERESERGREKERERKREGERKRELYCRFCSKTMLDGLFVWKTFIYLTT